MRRFVNGERFWEIGIEGKFVVTRSGLVNGKAKEERRFCKDGPKAYFEERLAKRLADRELIEDRAELRVVLDVTPRVVGLVGALPFERVPGPGPRADADRPVGADLVRVRDALIGAALPDPLMAVLRDLTGPAPAIGPLDPASAAVVLSVVPSREAADLVIGRMGLDGMIRAVLEGEWLHRDGAILKVGPRVRSDVPNWLLRGRELSRSVDEADLVAAVQRAQTADVAPWRLVDAAFLLPEAELGDRLLSRFHPSLPKGASHLAAVLDPAGWRQLGRLLGVDGTSARWVNVAPWLPTLVARYGHRALAVDQVQADLDLLRCIHHPDVARHLIAKLEKKGNEARIAALVAMAPFTLQVLASHGATSTGTKELARQLAARPGLAEAVLPLLDPTGARRLKGWTSVAPVRTVDEVPDALAGRPTRPVPRWLQLPKLPALLTADGQAEYPVVARARAIERIQALDEDLGPLCDPASLGRFVLGIVDQYVEYAGPARRQQEERERRTWQTEDGEQRFGIVDLLTPEDEQWVLGAARLFGDGDTARGLAERVRTFPKVLWQLAAEGVDSIAGIGDPSAMVELGSLARRGPAAVRKRANLHLQKMARRMGLDEASLDEILLPDLGLDDAGTLSLDFGPQRFVVGFDAELQPFVRAEDGEETANLPRIRKTDDPEKATAASAVWATLRKDVRTVGTTLVRRLEDGLRKRRTWPADHFLGTLVGHPFARHLAARLVWASGGQLFRVDEEGRPVDGDDEPVALDGPVTLPHPVLLEPETIDRWRGVFADYHVVQPFDQLDRAVHRADPVKDVGEWLARLAGATFQRGRLFALQQRGWRWSSPRGADGEPGPLVALIGDWVGADLVAHLVPVDPTDTSIESATVARVVWRGRRWVDADPVVFSEVVRDLG